MMLHENFISNIFNTLIMKKAKIILGSIAVLAAIGGAFAVKATTSSNNVFCANPINRKCDLKVTTWVIQPASPVKRQCTAPLPLTTTCASIGVIAGQ
ncbi:DUF6520 family protein [Chitinophaga solisilvae]|uniref:DUF6520 family protein n=1 Tax=Chitinophaga solisilvae TaxID=1233460 RepID=UPI00136B39B6|nr:DUF6520 family protein [Chitinophaga solisilvae]